MHSKISVFTLTVLFFTGACGDDGATTAGPDVTATTSATTDEQPTTTATTGEPSTTDDTTVDPSTSSDGATTTDGATSEAGTTTSEPGTDTGATTDIDPTGATTGEPDPAVVAACEGYCGRWDECGLQPDLAGCIAGCIDNQSGSSGACKAANLAALDCETALTCDELLASLEEGGPCSAEKAAATEACAESGCSESFGMLDQSCEWSRECRNAPVRQVLCDDESCTCLEDGQQTGQCAAEGACYEADAFADKAAACCGFA